MKLKFLHCRLSGAAWVVTLALLSAFAGTVCAQAKYGPLDKTPAAKFTSDDWQLFYAALDSLVATDTNGATQTWSNPKTGSSGKLELQGSFQASDGRSCKRLRIANHAAGLDGVATTNICRAGTGKWLFDTQAKP
jgi:17 kDa common-antigen outer membrane protein